MVDIEWTESLARKIESRSERQRTYADNNWPFQRTGSSVKLRSEKRLADEELQRLFETIVEQAIAGG